MRYDHKIICRNVRERSKVIDLGCGDGSLLSILKNEKRVIARGIDIDRNNVIKCFAKGISSMQLDIDKSLSEYKDKSFDYAILNDSLQTVKDPIKVLKEAVRIADKVIVSFPNFAHYSVRMDLLVNGRMPKSRSLPYEWYNTPNIHLFTIKDFEYICKRNGFSIYRRVFFNKKENSKSNNGFLANLIARNAVYVISKKKIIRFPAIMHKSIKQKA